MGIEIERHKQALRELRSWCEKWDAVIEALNSNCIINFPEDDYALYRYAVSEYDKASWAVRGVDGSDDLSFGPVKEEPINYRLKYEELLARVKELQKLIEDSGVGK